MVRKREELANENISDLPPPTHRHPMSGEPIWDQHAVRKLIQEDVAPWPDFGGNTIKHGDRIRHPDGLAGTVVRLPNYADVHDAWCVVYGDRTVSRLSLQIGERGQAVVLSAEARDPGKTGPWCCERAQAQGVQVCKECAEISAGYSEAMRSPMGTALRFGASRETMERHLNVSSPAQDNSTSWKAALAVADTEAVDAMLQGFSQDPTGDHGVMVVRAVMDHILPPLRAAVLKFVQATDALHEADERKTWVSGFKNDMTAGERMRRGQAYREARAELVALLKD